MVLVLRSTIDAKDGQELKIGSPSKMWLRGLFVT